MSKLNPNMPTTLGPMFIHFYNVSTGNDIWTGEIRPNSLDDMFPLVKQFFKHNDGYELQTFDNEQMIGIFTIGPLPALFAITTDETDAGITPLVATRMFEHCRKLAPIPKTVQ